MKLKADIIGTQIRAAKLMNNGRNDKEAAAYYEGIVAALEWVLTKREDVYKISQYRDIKLDI